MPPVPPSTPEPPTPPVFSGAPVSPPSSARQSWGTVISILIIVAMIITGAFYTWGKRIAEQRALIGQQTSTAAATTTP